MSSPGSNSDEPRRPNAPVEQPNPSARGVSAVLGVFTGTGRGAVIGAIVGTGACFLFLMVYLAYDLLMGNGQRLPPGTMVATLALGAVWCLASSLVGGGTVGALLGAIVGTLFPVR
jgi:hypothetical protein